jgi:hypothetical protein
MIYVEVDLRFFTLFWGILFSICSSSCSQILAQRLPSSRGGRGSPETPARPTACGAGSLHGFQDKRPVA